MQTYFPLPDGLPVPNDDGSADHLKGLAISSIHLSSTDGTIVDVSVLPGRTVIYAYPKTGVPGVAMPNGWDEIPGARGCTPETCAFRDHYADLNKAGANAVFGLSTQSVEYQRELRDRLHLPFQMLSDADLKLTEALQLPTITVDGETLIKRLTAIADDGVVTHVFYPIFPPDGHAVDVLAWLKANPR